MSKISLGKGPFGPVNSFSTLIAPKLYHTTIRAGGQDGREIEDLPDGCVCENISLVMVRLEIFDELKQSDLMVNDEQHSVVLVQTDKLEVG